MRHMRFCVALGIGLLAACSPAPAPNEGDTAAEAAVRAALESYYQAFSDRDWDRFESHFWEGANLTTIWQPAGEDSPRVVATSVTRFIADAPSGPGSREIFEERMTSLTLRVEGALAQAWAEYDARFGDPGDISEWSGVDAFSLLYHDGQWRITSLAYVPD